MADMSNHQGIGGAVKRKEDFRFVTGFGRYTDDINRPGQLYAWIVRSMYAHALITSIDPSAALAMEGVEAVFTGADMAADNVKSLPCGWLIHNRDTTPMNEPPHPPLAVGAVRHVGDPVAVVLASSRNQARDAAEQVKVGYQTLPAVVSSEQALAPGAVQLHKQAPGNVCFDWELGNAAGTDQAFAQAAHVTNLELVNHRLVASAIEPRCALAEYDLGCDSYTLYTTSQNPHVIRLLMGAFVLNIPEHKLRVIAPDVGGGFGSKIYHYAEEAIVTWASRKVRRPVKWTAERSESFVSDAQGRDHLTQAELALSAEGRFLGLRVKTKANLGAYLSTFAPSIPTYLYATLLSGQYKIPAIHCSVTAVFTNTVPVDAYRGAGRPEAAYVVERLVETAALELGIDRVELRRRNLIQPDDMPYQTPVAVQYDCGHFAHNIDLALPKIDYAGLAGRKAEAKTRGMWRGIGFSTYIEACGLAPSNVAGALGARAGLYEAAGVRVHPTGSITVFTGSHSHGQGHETTFAQLVADRFGLSLDQIEIAHGDTALIPFGMGTYGSRSLAVGGSAIAKALDKIEHKAKWIAAHMLGVAPEAVELHSGQFRAKETDKSVSFAEVALAAYVPHNLPLDQMTPGLEEQAFYDPTNFTFPNGCQVCELEIDPQTGAATIVRFVCVDDFGKVVNPLVVEGQVHGGLAQGIGQALMENCVYDPSSGQLMTGGYTDYQLPRAQNFPMFETSYHEQAPCTHNPLGVKGCGEAGTIGATPAVMNAVIDALYDGCGITHLDMPATPERIWKAIRGAGGN